MLTRDWVVKGLQRMVDQKLAPRATLDFVRAAIELLTPPTTEEIEAARDAVKSLPAVECVSRVCLDALDALAREPGLEAEKTAGQAELGAAWKRVNGCREVLGEALGVYDDIDKQCSLAVTRIFALEAKLARVRKERDRINRMAPGSSKMISIVEHLDAILADEATP